MATYAIGDVHGCFLTFQRLLRRIDFDPGQDRLWFVGDLVNRGPRSLAMLRWAVEQGDRIVVVLGNHDLHLLALAAGVSEVKKRDTLEEVLTSPDRDDLLAWLGERPLLHRQGEHILVHAGLFPSWTPADAERLAREVEERLQSPKRPRLLATVDRKTAVRWRESLREPDRADAALAAFVRLRVLDSQDRILPTFSGTLREVPARCHAWFSVPHRRSAGATVIFGHWPSVGLHVKGGVAALDTGCVWGRELTALRLDDWRIFQAPAEG